MMRNEFLWSIGLCVCVGACTQGSEPEFGEAITIAASGASNPTVALDARGQVLYVAWVGAESNRSDVWVARSTDGVSFALPVRANDVIGDAAPHEQAPAQIDVGPEGNVYVVWQNNTVADGRRFPYSDIRFARSTDGGLTFEPAMTVNDDADGPPSSHTFHDVLASPDGTVYVSWIDSRVRTLLENDSGASLDGSAGSESGSGGHGGHGEAGLPGPEIRVARSVDGGRTFEPGVVVAAEACPCCRTSLAVGPDGALYIAWRTVLEGNIRDVVVARSDDRGSTFTQQVRVSADDWVFDACPHAGPSLAVDAEGAVHVAWFTGAPPEPGVYRAVSHDRGASFEHVTAVMTGEWVPPSQVKISMDARGTLVTAWDDRRREHPTVHVSISPAATSDVREASIMNGTSPAVSSAGGRTIVAWLDGDAVRVRVSGASNPRSGSQ